jgi:hypothetical protein
MSATDGVWAAFVMRCDLVRIAPLLRSSLNKLIDGMAQPTLASYCRPRNDNESA